MLFTRCLQLVVVIMAKSRRSFSVEQKLRIIQEAEQAVVMQTLCKNGLAHSLYLRWKRQSIREELIFEAPVSQGRSGTQSPSL
jgi:transposase-like protein